MLGLDIKSESSLDGLLKYSRADLEAHEKDLISEISQLSKEIQQLEEIDAAADDTLEEFEQFEPPEWCVPIRANVLEFDFESLAKECQFDVIMMDPPWVLAGSAPTRGVKMLVCFLHLIMFYFFFFFLIRLRSDINNFPMWLSRK
eukprot:Sdes_comp20901_c0_seq1m18063